MTTPRFLTALFFSIFLLAACNPESQQLPDARNKGLDSLVNQIPDYRLDREGDTLEYRLLSRLKTEPLGKKKAKDLTRISVVYPQALSFAPAPEVLDSVNKRVLQELLLSESGDLAYEHLDERLEAFVKDFQQYELSGSKWVCEIKVEVLLNTPYLLSLHLEEMSFTGGAHANTFSRYLNFNVKTGALLSLEDLLLPSSIDAFTQAARKRFEQFMKAEMSKNQDAQPWQEASWSEFHLPEQFFISEQGLVFSYSAYELNLPLSKGEIRLVLPYGDFLPMINKEVLR